MKTRDKFAWTLSGLAAAASCFGGCITRVDHNLGDHPQYIQDEVIDSSTIKVKNREKIYQDGELIRYDIHVEYEDGRTDTFYVNPLLKR